MATLLSVSSVEQIRNAVDQQRLTNTAAALVEVPSPTRSAGRVADRLASLLELEGFAVERPVDDGNTFASVAGIPALTHGPAARGAHTLEECVPLGELVRVAQVYALTAAAYCPG